MELFYHSKVHFRPIQSFSSLSYSLYPHIMRRRQAGLAHTQQKDRLDVSATIHSYSIHLNFLFTFSAWFPTNGGLHCSQGNRTGSVSCHNALEPSSIINTTLLRSATSYNDNWKPSSKTWKSLHGSIKRISRRILSSGLISNACVPISGWIL